MERIYTPKTKEKTSVLRHETGCTLNVSIPLRSDRYMDEFVKLTCAPDMILANIFPNAKEITESFALFSAIRKLKKVLDLKDPEIRCLVIGDGSTPRTAATVAFRSSWVCYSVDPNLRSKDNWCKIKRLEVFPCLHSEFDYSLLRGRTVIVLHPHSHAPFHEVYAMVDKVASKHYHIAMPCCDELCAPKPPTFSYDDNGVHSPKRSIFVWA